MFFFLSSLVTDERNAMHSKQNLSSAGSCETLLLCCFHSLLGFLSSPVPYKKLLKMWLSVKRGCVN